MRTSLLRLLLRAALYLLLGLGRAIHEAVVNPPRVLLQILQVHLVFLVLLLHAIERYDGRRLLQSFFYSLNIPNRGTSLSSISFLISRIFDPKLDGFGGFGSATEYTDAPWLMYRIF